LPISSIILHPENSRFGTSSKTKEFIDETGVKLKDHRSYSPDLIPFEFQHLRNLKKNLGGRRYLSGKEVDRAVFEHFSSFSKEAWLRVMDK
jgi:hypothetical protein